MLVSFTKMHGLGNDFVMINNCLGDYNLSKQQIKNISDRHFGVGCDQLLVIEKSTLEKIDFKYRIYNADGAEVQQCGNGARCFARYVYEKELTNKTTIAVETLNGVIYLYLEDSSNIAEKISDNKNTRQTQIRVDMGKPNFSPLQLPFLIDDPVAIKKNLYQLDIVDGKKNSIEHFVFSAVSMGNPHVTLIVEDLKNYDVNRVGTLFLKQKIFPEGVNVGFMQIIDENNILLRVYERGAGETLACGSGACAAVVNGIQQGVLKHHVRVQLTTGFLIIKWAGNSSQNVDMSGPASFVFEGQIEI
ncbi:MAG: diaminopimelate epimerase [Pseudomonadota bacterium]